MYILRSKKGESPSALKYNIFSPYLTRGVPHTENAMYILRQFRQSIRLYNMANNKLFNNANSIIISTPMKKNTSCTDTDYYL